MADIIRVRAPGGAEQLEWMQVELPPPGADEIRLRQTAIGVNFIDIYQRQGLYGLPEAKIPGIEAVGIVSAVGADVKGIELVDRIA
jgi:NADPH:quinone reductase